MNGAAEVLDTLGERQRFPAVVAGEGAIDVALPPEFTDEALALDFAAIHEPDLRYVSKWGHWLAWDGHRWRAEDTLLAFDNARRICRSAANRAIIIPGGRTGARMAAKIASAGTVGAIERLAKADRRLAATIEQWDREPDMLNTPAGIVDLHSGSTFPARRDC